MAGEPLRAVAGDEGGGEQDEAALEAEDRAEREAGVAAVEVGDGEDQQGEPQQGQQKADTEDKRGAFVDERDAMHSRDTPPVGLQEPLIPSGGPIKRQDTNSGELEEFVDAAED